MLDSIVESGCMLRTNADSAVCVSGWLLQANVRTERSWHRVAVACEAGAKAQLGASAEVVLMAAHHKR
jgi:hypothetical protein